MSTYRHWCGKDVPNSAYHCGGCCETFRGLSAFDYHRQGMTCDFKVKEPFADGTGLWVDEHGYWHAGKPMTDEQKEARFGKSQNRAVGGLETDGAHIRPRDTFEAAGVQTVGREAADTGAGGTQ